MAFDYDNMEVNLVDEKLPETMDIDLGEPQVEDLDTEQGSAIESGGVAKVAPKPVEGSALVRGAINLAPKTLEETGKLISSVEQGVKNIATVGYVALAEAGRGMKDLVETVFEKPIYAAMGMEAPVNPYPTNREILEAATLVTTLGDKEIVRDVLDNYDSSEELFDIGGSVASAFYGGNVGASTLTKGSKFYNGLSKLGLSDNVLNYAFSNPQGVKNSLINLFKYSYRGAKAGMKPELLAETAIRSRSIMSTAFKESLKTTVASEVGALALNFNNDVLYPHQTMMEGAVNYGLVPLGFTALAPAATARGLRVVKNRASVKAGKVLQSAKNVTGAEVQAAKAMSKELSANSATLASYEIDALEKLQTSATEQFGTEAGKSFSAMIESTKAQRRNYSSRLIEAKLAPEEKVTIIENLDRGFKNKPNLLMNAEEVLPLPTTSEGLMAYTSGAAKKASKAYESNLKKLSPDEQATAEPFVKPYFGVLKTNGDLVPSQSYIVGFRDAPDYAKKLHSNVSKTTKTTSASYGVNGKTYKAEFDFSGNARLVHDGKIMENKVVPELADLQYATAQSQLDNSENYLARLLKEKKNLNFAVDVDKANYLQLDYLEEMQNRLGDRFGKMFSLKSADTAMPSLSVLNNNAKAKAIQQRLVASARRVADGKPDFKYDLNDIFESTFNLRTKDGSLPSDHLDVIKNYKTNDVEAINAFDAVFEKSDRLAFTPTKKPTLIKYSTETTDYTRVEDLVVQRNVQENNRVRDALTRNVDSNDSDFVASIAEDVFSHPAYDVARNVDELVYTGNRGGAIGEAFTQPLFQADSNPVLQSVIRLSEELDVKTAKQINDRMKPLSNAVSSLMDSVDDKQGLSKFIHQSRSGYVIDSLEDAADGVHIRLAPDNTVNKQIAEHQKRFYKDVDVDIASGYLPDPLNPSRPLVVSPKVAEALEALESNSRDIFKARNQLNDVFGVRQVQNYRPYHVPPKDMSKKALFGVLDEDGNLITMVSGNTKEQAMDIARREQSLINQPTKVVSREAIKDYSALSTGEANWLDMTDFGEYVNTVNSSNKQGVVRTSVGATVDTGDAVIKDLIDGINRDYHAIAHHTRMATFMNEADYLRTLKTGLSSEGIDAKNIDTYINATLGRLGSDQFKKDSIGGVIYGAIDNGLMAINKKISNREYKRDRSIYETFANDKELQTAFGWKPENVEATFAEYNRINPTNKLILPRESMAKFTGIMSTAFLRLLNVGFAGVNFLGLPVMGGAVARSLNRRLGENKQMFEARVGAYGTAIDLKESRDFIGVFNPVASQVSAFEFMLGDDFKPVYAAAEKAGYFDTTTSLMLEGLINPTMNMKQKGFKRGIDVLATISDSSERLSKVLAYSQGYNIANKSLKLSTEKAKSVFAKGFMDDVVANYQASAKPLVHRQGLGSPLGLFQTYALNQAQKMFDFVEAGDKRALAAMLATQGFIFGAKAVPAVSALENRLYPQSAGGSFYQTIADNEGHGAAQAVMYGVPSAVSGLNFSIKGDMSDVKLPISLRPTDNVMYRTGESLMNGIGEMIDAAKVNGLTPRRAAEIMSVYGVFPSVKMASKLALGYSVDRAGQLVVEDTRSGLELGATLMSMKTLDEAVESDILYRTKDRQFKQQALMTALRKGLRTEFRSLLDGGEIDGEVVLQLVGEYLSNGGKSENAKSYIESQLKVAITSRGSQAIERLAKEGTEPSIKDAITLLGLRTDSVHMQDNEDSALPLPDPTSPIETTQAGTSSGFIYDDVTIY